MTGNGMCSRRANSICSSSDCAERPATFTPSSVELGRVVSEPARLRRAPSGARDRVPAVGRRPAGDAGRRIDVEDRPSRLRAQRGRQALPRSRARGPGSRARRDGRPRRRRPGRADRPEAGRCSLQAEGVRGTGRLTARFSGGTVAWRPQQRNTRRARACDLADLHGRTRVHLRPSARARRSSRFSPGHRVEEAARRAVVHGRDAVARQHGSVGEPARDVALWRRAEDLSSAPRRAPRAAGAPSSISAPGAVT